MEREEATEIYLAQEVEDPARLRADELITKKLAGSATQAEVMELRSLYARLSSTYPGYGQPSMIGESVRHSDGRVGIVDRVDIGDASLYVWFGETNPHDGSKIAEAVPCAQLELGGD